MCLIAYSPKGAMVDRATLAYAYNQNPDGIGIMSAYGIEKFMGKKALKRARRYLETFLVPENAAYAIHFRWATHGDVKMSNTHPYESPAGTHWIMHNGVLSVTTAESSADESDTAVYVRKFLDEAPGFDDTQFWTAVEKHIGWGNKFCVMDANGEFHICNDDAGTWMDGIWFSNTYSLPPSMLPARTYGGYSGGYYGTRTEYKPTTTPYQSQYGYTNALGMWVAKELWDRVAGKMLPNPMYKAADHYPERVPYADVYYGSESVETATRILRPVGSVDERWDGEDRRSYYEALEAGLTADEDIYHDVGTRAAVAKVADLQQTQPLLALPYIVDKPDADIGGDFSDPADDEEQSNFRKYLAKVAAGIHV